MRGRRSGSVLVGLVAVLVLLVGTTSSSAEGWRAEDKAPDGAQQLDLSAEEEQARVATVGLEPWFTLLSGQPGFASGGFNEDRSGLEFYWHGPLGDEARSIVADAENQGIAVVVREVPYSEEEIYDLGRAFVEQLRRSGFEVMVWAPTRERDAIEISGPEITPDMAKDARVREIESLELPANVSVVVLPWEEPVAADSRHADTGDPTPGAEVKWLEGSDWEGSCTAALGLRKPGGGHYLLTALHCFSWQTGGQAKTRLNGKIGTTTGRPTFYNTGMKLDAALISFGAGNGITDSVMFFGPNDSSSKGAVAATGLVPYNTPLCSSGSATGTRCVTTRASELAEICYEGYCVMGVWVSSEGSLVWGGGDSGGTVYYLGSGGRVVTGVISGVSNWQNCGSVNYYGPTTRCSWSAGFFAPISKIMDKLTPLGFLVNAQ